MPDPAEPHSIRGLTHQQLRPACGSKAAITSSIISPLCSLFLTLGFPERYVTKRTSLTVPWFLQISASCSLVHENGSPEMKILCFSIIVLYLNTYKDISVKISLCTACSNHVSQAGWKTNWIDESQYFTPYNNNLGLGEVALIAVLNE